MVSHCKHVYVLVTVRSNRVVLFCHMIHYASNGLRSTTNKKPKVTTIQLVGSERGTIWKINSWRAYNRSAKPEIVVMCSRGRGLWDDA